MPASRVGRMLGSGKWLGKGGSSAEQNELPLPIRMQVTRRDIIVIGASAGGVGALRELAAGLEPDLAAAVFVVVHLPAWQKSQLPSLIGGNGSLPAKHPESGHAIKPGAIYIAPPDQHLLRCDSMQLWHGPKENGLRPAINPLFRSAAVEFGPRVIGVILSGSLDDGSTGLWWVKHYGGVAIVQDPLLAAYGEMPRNAMEHVDVDYSLGVNEIALLLNRLVKEGEPESSIKE